ncbi:bifunctional glycosyltransferase/CDP-glycerol:glycerophosphate glycerophosphotransferase [Arthrobacter sp. CAN_A1]|uniref:bifunctional glycosyltransferase/CDP-glycerol:glycerophosphate glycerophosphotransferase n=1 Tax=Arthrobacter sp. CAN_A1 TaxID=2787717 RepID=UPI0018C9163E
MPGRNKPILIDHLRHGAEFQLRRIWRTLPPEQRKKLRSALHPADTAKVTRAVTGQGMPGIPLGPPRLAIVVAVTQPQQDVASTLRNLVSQSFGSLEIHIVDITPGSIAQIVAEQYATRDHRIHFHAVSAPSYGAAFEYGVAMSKAPLLLMLTAGDVLKDDGLRCVVNALRENESDFAAGTVGLRKGSKFVVGAAQTALHTSSSHATSIEEIPELLQDGFLSNKVFTRTFWVNELSAIPTAGKHWQHQVLQTAYVRASTFSLVGNNLCNVTGDVGAIQPSREELCSLADVVERVDRTLALDQLFRDEISISLYRQWITYELGEALFPYYEVIPRGNDAYWESIIEGVGRLGSAELLHWEEIRLHNRLILAAVLGQNRHDATAICVSRSDLGSSFATRYEDGELVAVPAYLDELHDRPARSLLVCQPVDLRLVSVLNQFNWIEDGRLEIGGFAYISSVDPLAGDLQIEAFLVDQHGSSVIPLDIKRHQDHRIDWEANDNWTSYAASGFSAVINYHQLLEGHAPDIGTWSVRIRLKAFDRELEGSILKRDLAGATGTLPIAQMMNNTRLAVEFRPAEGLTFVRVAPTYTASSIELDGRTLRLTVNAHSAPLAAKIIVECSKLGLRRTATCVDVRGDTADYEIVFPRLSADAAPRAEHQWQVLLDSGYKSPQPIAWDGDSDALGGSVDSRRRLRARLTGYGYLRFEERKFRIIADNISISTDERSILLEGTADFTALHLPRLILSSGKAVIAAEDVALDVRANSGSNRFFARFPLSPGQWQSDDLAPEAGAYSIRYVPPKAEDTAAYWIPVDNSLQQALPLRIKAANLEVGITRTAVAGALTVHLRPPLEADEIGRYNQRVLREGIQADQRPLQDSVLFMCFGGRRATDSTRRILEEFQRRQVEKPMYWAIADYSVPVPDGAQPVLIGSRRWYELLAEAATLINNNNFPYYFRKRPGQTYIQTWHGTPLKKLGNDVASTNFSLSYWNLMWREATYWDALLAQNDYAAEVLANCFGFEGPVVSEGYPRNDSLNSPDIDETRSGIREKLGIPADKTAILYAPTWRDDGKNASKQYEMVTYLDFEKAQNQLGDDYVLLLRGHHNIASQRQTASNKFVVDVTEYPEVNDLYIAADILVNDYSSVMFDFCVTGKPILFLTPDIAQYRDSTRGFYFDLEELAPGPLLSTTEEVVQAIKKISVVERKYATAYTAFVEKFAPRCDGNATSRVFDAIWQGGASSESVLSVTGSSS